MTIDKDLVIKVDSPKPDEESKWYVVQQQEFKIDKEEFILEKYNKDYPNFKINDFRKLLRIVSRNEKLQSWYAKTSLLFADTIQLPLAYKDLFLPDEYKEMFTDISMYKKNLAKESEEIQTLSNKFNKDLEEIQDRYKNKNKDLLSKNKYYPIITMNSNKLPLRIQLQIEDYSPQTADVVEKRKVFAREMLINYKRALIKYVSENENVDVFELIDSQILK